MDVYEANDSDYELDEYGNFAQSGNNDGGAVDPSMWEDDVYSDEEAYYPPAAPPPRDERYAYGKFIESRTIVTKEKVQKPLPPGVAGVPPEAYFDDFALVNCWQSAVVDYKYYHPSQFAPLREAPRKIEQKQHEAPLWYGPIASTSGLSPPTPAPLAGSDTTTVVPVAGTQKRKATAATHANTSSLPLRDEPPHKKKRGANGQAKGKGKGKAVVVERDELAWSPQSPEFQRPELPVQAMLRLSNGSLDTSSVSSAPPTANVITRSFPAGPALPTPSQLYPLPRPHANGNDPSRPPATLGFPTPPPNLLTQRSYPAPPSIVPLGPDDPVPTQEEESPEELLQTALWGWFNAGYQTAMYHASLARGAHVGSNFGVKEVGASGTEK